LNEAEATLKEAVARQEQVTGADHELVGYTRANLAAVLLDEGDAAGAERESRSALRIYALHYANDHLYVAAAQRVLGLALISQRKLQEAEPLLRSAIATQQKNLSDPKSPQLALSQAAMGELKLAERAYDQAEPLLLGQYPAVLQTQGPQDGSTKRLKLAIQRLYRETGRADQLDAWFQNQVTAAR
jgi:tetratricopeptide (TPR) repeat protein